MATVSKNIVMAAISHVQDPELRIGVVDLGLIYDVIVEDGEATILMTLTTPACPYGPQLMNTIKEVTLGLRGIKKANIELVWDPPWDPAEMASDYAKDVLGIW